MRDDGHCHAAARTNAGGVWVGAGCVRDDGLPCGLRAHSIAGGKFGNCHAAPRTDDCGIGGHMLYRIGVGGMGEGAHSCW